MCSNPPRSEEPSSTSTSELETDEEKWFDRLQECFERTDFIERVASRQRERTEGEFVIIGTKPEEETEYVIVSKEDAVEAMADMVASAVVQCPEAYELTPTQLQDAIVRACKDIKRSKVKTCWGWGMFFYRTAAWGYAAFQFYANPWIVLAILRAFWAVPKGFIIRLFT